MTKRCHARSAPRPRRTLPCCLLTTAAHHSPLILTQVATGTGIAPYRSFIRRLFVEKTPFAAVRT